MLFPPDGPPVGLVSGGCLEGDLALRAEEVRRSGEARTVVYDMRSPDDIVWGPGLGCNGEIRVLLERVEPGEVPPYLRFIERCRRERRPGVVATLFDVEGAEEGAIEGGRLLLDADERVEGRIGGDRLEQAVLDDSRAVLARRRSRVRRYEPPAGPAEALIEFIAPPTHLLVFGAGLDAAPVVRLASALGWRVSVFDNRQAQVTADSFPEAEAVRVVEFDRLAEAELEIDAATPALVMTHHFLHDETILNWLLSTEAPYVGVLGPRKRTEKLLARLDLSAEAIERLHGPVGLDIGSESPEEIALSALAEIQARLNRRSGGSLRDRRLPLHDWPR